MTAKIGTILAAALSAGIALAAFDVRDFGAKGDGVTDDTAAFQAAIDAVAAQSAGKIVIPYSPKGYRIAGPGRESFDGKPCRGQLVIPPAAKNIAFEGEMPCKLLYSYQVRPPEAVKSHFTPTRFGLLPGAPAGGGQVPFHPDALREDGHVQHLPVLGLDAAGGTRPEGASVDDPRDRRRQLLQGKVLDDAGVDREPRVPRASRQGDDVPEGRMREPAERLARHRARLAVLPRRQRGRHGARSESRSSRIPATRWG